MSKISLSSILTLWAIPTFAFQGHLSLKMAVPPVQDVRPWQDKWQTGDFAIYIMFSDEDLTQPVGSYEVRIIDEKIVDSQRMLHFKLRRTEKDVDTSLSFWIPAEPMVLTLIRASEIKADTQFGRKSVEPPKSIEAEIPIRSKTLDIPYANAYKIEYSNNRKPGIIWTRKEMGPLGILRAKLWFDDEYRYFELEDYGPTNN